MPSQIDEERDVMLLILFAHIAKTVFVSSMATKTISLGLFAKVDHFQRLVILGDRWLTPEHVTRTQNRDPRTTLKRARCRASAL